MSGEATVDGGVLLGADAALGLEKALRINGAICGACDRPCYFSLPERVAPTHEFLFAEVKVYDDAPKIIVTRGYACDRSDCDGKARFLDRPDIIAARTMPSWEVVVPPAPDPDPEPS